jgi:hypothetical protein
LRNAAARNRSREQGAHVRGMDGRVRAGAQSASTRDRRNGLRHFYRNKSGSLAKQAKSLV